ncbi:DUF805 domain-containing protein [Hyphomonas sp.]|uniref:DUF805 domain-containing protein n=1 Tax=Hyphomonas sp. TaxID=87 RepID=UPI00391CB631
MRGEVLRPDDDTGPGLILGEDGRRYTFRTDRVHRRAALAAGTPVDFVSLGEEARDIYVLSRPAAPPPAALSDAAYAPAVAAKADGLFTYFLRTLTRNYFQFYGRARRAEYWGYFLFWLVSLVILFIVDGLISAVFLGGDPMGSPDFVPVLTVLFWLYSIIPGMAVTIRRLHDQDISGWLYLINVLPSIGGIILFILMFFDSRPNPNKHGASPKYGPAQTINVFT